jgi:ascorbate-specific PTS system EIIC-type component UlaA
MEEFFKALGPILTGQPAVFLALICLCGYWLERKRCNKERADHLKTSDKLVELSTASIKADTEHTASIQALTKVLDSIERRLP